MYLRTRVWMPRFRPQANPVKLMDETVRQAGVSSVNLETNRDKGPLAGPSMMGRVVVKQRGVG